MNKTECTTKISNFLKTCTTKLIMIWKTMSKTKTTFTQTDQSINIKKVSPQSKTMCSNPSKTISSNIFVRKSLPWENSLLSMLLITSEEPKNLATCKWSWTSKRRNNKSSSNRAWLPERLNSNNSNLHSTAFTRNFSRRPRITSPFLKTDLSKIIK